MLIFIDESGDLGTKMQKGSSKLFIVALVVFEEEDEATACDQCIDKLKKDLMWNLKDEFHFKNNSNRVREKFLKAVSPYNFFYYGLALDKIRLCNDGFPDEESFYKYACGLVFENAKEKINNAIIVIDESGSTDFKRQLQKYLKGKMNKNSQRLIKKIKMQKSKCNNLIQLADYVAGAIHRSVNENKKKSNTFRNLISHREISVQTWPK